MDITTLMGGVPTSGVGMGATIGMTMPGSGTINIPTAEELEDVNFTPPFYPRFAPDQQNQQSQSQW